MGIFGLLPIIITIVVVVPSLFFVVRLFKNLDAGQKQNAELMRSGAVAQGRLVSAQMGGMSVSTGAHRHLQLLLTIDIYPQAHGQYRAQQQPQRIQLTQVVSELQMGQLQPGAHVEVRYDPNNPQRAVLSGIAGYGGMQPLQVMQVPGGAKVGLMIGIAGGAVGIIVAIVVGVQSMSFGSSMDSSSSEDEEEEEDEPKSKSKKSGDGVCAEATACCKVVHGKAGADNCESWEKTDFEPACKKALEGYVKAADRAGKSCD